MKRLLYLLVIICLIITFVVSCSEEPLEYFNISSAVEGDYTYSVAYNQATILKYNGSGTSITIPSTLDDFSVIGIGDRAFYNCTDLTSIIIPNSVTRIGDSVFGECSNLETVIIGNSVTSIVEFTFGNCTSLNSVTIGNAVTSIDSDAFYNCNSITKISCYYEAVDKPAGWNVGWDSNLSITWEYLGD